jgi:hypothetical protein
MRIKLVEEKNAAYYKGKSDVPEDIKEQAIHNQKYFEEYFKKANELDKELNYAYQSGIVKGVIFEYELKGELCSDELIHTAIKESKNYRHFSRDKTETDFVNLYIKK